MGLGTNLKKILKDKGKTLKWLSAETGISVNTLYSITKRDSTRISIDNVSKIAAALGITTSQLMGEIVIATDEEEDELFKVLTEEPELTKEEIATYNSILLTEGFEEANKYRAKIIEHKNFIRIRNYFTSLTKLPTDESTLSKEQDNPEASETLLAAFHTLNQAGKAEAIKRIQEMARLEEVEEVVEEKEEKAE